MRSISTGGVPNSPPLPSRAARLDRNNGAQSANTNASTTYRRDSKLSDSEFEDGISLLSGSIQSMCQSSLSSLNTRVMSISQRTELALRKHQVRSTPFLSIYNTLVPHFTPPTYIDANGKNQVWKRGRWEGGITNECVNRDVKQIT